MASFGHLYIKIVFVKKIPSSHHASNLHCVLLSFSQKTFRSNFAGFEQNKGKNLLLRFMKPHFDRLGVGYFNSTQRSLTHMHVTQAPSNQPMIFAGQYTAQPGKNTDLHGYSTVTQLSTPPSMPAPAFPSPSNMSAASALAPPLLWPQFASLWGVQPAAQYDAAASAPRAQAATEPYVGSRTQLSSSVC